MSEPTNTDTDTRDRWIAEQTDHNVNIRGMALDVAKAAATRAARDADAGLLDPDLLVRLDIDDGSGKQEWVSCRDMLKDPASYHGRTGSDPLTPCDKVTWKHDPGDDTLECRSQMPGGRHFTLAYRVADVIAAWQTERHKDTKEARARLRTLWLAVRWSPNSAMAQREYQQVVTARVPMPGGLDFATWDAKEATGDATITLADTDRLIRNRDIPTLRNLHDLLGSLFDDEVRECHNGGDINEMPQQIERWLTGHWLGDRLSARTWLSRPVAPPDRLLGDLITTTIKAFIAGYRGVGKTLLGFALAVAMARGQDFLRWRAGRPARVLYIDGEMPAELLVDRLRGATGTTDVPDTLFLFSKEDAEHYAQAYPEVGDYAPLNTPEGHEFMQRLCDMVKPDVVIFDNVQVLLPGVQTEEETWTGALPLVEWLTQQRIGQLWFDHTGHDTSRQYGTSRKAGQFDTLGILTELKASAPDDKVLRLSFDPPGGKARRSTPQNWQEFAPVTLRLKQGVWSEDGPAGTAGKAGSSKLDKVKPGSRKFHKALLDAIASNGTGPHETTLDAWEQECVRTGLLKPILDTDDHKARRSKRAVLRNAKLDLEKAGAIKIDGDRVRDLMGVAAAATG